MKGQAASLTHKGSHNSFINLVTPVGTFLLDKEYASSLIKKEPNQSNPSQQFTQFSDKTKMMTISSISSSNDSHMYEETPTMKTSSVITANEKSQSKVSFGNVEIREYARCLGNNPTTIHDGPSLSIDWHYSPSRVVDLDRYEHFKSTTKHANSDPLDVVPGYQRVRIIREHTDCTDEEIELNVHECYLTDRQRYLCLESQELEVFHIAIENFQRKCRRFRQRMGKRNKKTRGEKKHQRQQQPTSMKTRVFPTQQGK